MGKTLLMLHGRDFKPPRTKLRKLWLDALRFGIERDQATVKVEAFDRAHKELVYFGDESNAFLSQLRGLPVPDDTASRRQTLEALKKYRADRFTKRSYNKLPGDYRKMETWGLVSSRIEDHRIYNLSVRNGRSNPHHSGGYLIHPKMAQLVAAWL